jgi:hypothetical protein
MGVMGERDALRRRRLDDGNERQRKAERNAQPEQETGGSDKRTRWLCISHA